MPLYEMKPAIASGGDDDGATPPDLLDGALRLNKLSFPMADELDGMAVFVAVAEAKGFRAEHPG